MCANPVTGKIQRELFRDGPLRTLLTLPDFVRTFSDEWFRPVAIHFGPRGFHIVDWYNTTKSLSTTKSRAIIPIADNTPDRIWRVAAKSNRAANSSTSSQKYRTEPIAYLGSDSLLQSPVPAQIVDRQTRNLA